VFTAEHDATPSGTAHWSVPAVLLVGPLPCGSGGVGTRRAARRVQRLRERVRQRDRETLLLLYWFCCAGDLLLARSRLQLYVLPLLCARAHGVRALVSWPG